MWKRLLKPLYSISHDSTNENRFRMNSIGNSQFPSLFRMFIQAMKIFWRMKSQKKPGLFCQANSHVHLNFKIKYSHPVWCGFVLPFAFLWHNEMSNTAQIHIKCHNLKKMYFIKCSYLGFQNLISTLNVIFSI